MIEKESNPDDLRQIKNRFNLTYRDAKQITIFKPTTTLRIEPIGDNRWK